ncbi:unnamed protein product [Ixodes pacificus]
MSDEIVIIINLINLRQYSLLCILNVAYHTWLPLRRFHSLKKKKKYSAHSFTYFKLCTQRARRVHVENYTHNYPYYHRISCSREPGNKQNKNRYGAVFVSEIWQLASNEKKKKKREKKHLKKRANHFETFSSSTCENRMRTSKVRES